MGPIIVGSSSMYMTCTRPTTVPMIPIVGA
jgi:hypothetical protein